MMAPRGNQCQFQVGQDVLARWNDGLFYLGTILKVDEKNDRCYMRFEDDSEYWALFKDIQKGPNQGSEGEISCSVCLGENSEAPNEIVLCDYCGLPYHQKCHIPEIGPEVLKLDVKWSCRPCVFAKNAKKGGAARKGANAKEMLTMKQSLPYDLDSLSWDAHHKRNFQQCYCYCGGPGDWYMKMLQCCRCQQWFHEACMQCLDKPLQFGDRFYIFVCACCNTGPEYLKRLDLCWVDIVHLALFNLTLQHNVKYYDFEESIMPWINQTWDKLSLRQLNGATKAERERYVLKTLESRGCMNDIFQCGKESKKRFTLWGLRVRLPPPGPPATIPCEGPVTEDVMNTLTVTGKAPQTVFVPLESGFIGKDDRVGKAAPSQSPLPIKFHKRRVSTDEDDALFRKAKKARKTLLDSYSGSNKLDKPDKPDKPEKVNGSMPVKQVRKLKEVNGIPLTVNQGYKGYTGNPNNYAATSRIPAQGFREKPTGKRTKVTLDSIIPWPASYEGKNHPFKTDLEKVQEMECSRLKERLLNSYQNVCMMNMCDIDSDSMTETTDSDCQSLSTLTDLSDSQPLLAPPPKKKRGRKSKVELQRIAAAAALAEEEAMRSKKQRNIPSFKPFENGRVPSHTKNVLDRSTLDGLSNKEVPLKQLKWSVSSYFGAADRLANGERFQVMGRRMTSDGNVQYLIQWEGFLG